MKNNEMELRRFTKAMETIAAVFGRRTSPEMIQGYFEALENYDVDRVERACQWLSKNADKFPLPVNIRDCMRDSSHYANPDIVPISEAEYARWMDRSHRRCHHCKEKLKHGIAYYTGKAFHPECLQLKKIGDTAVRREKERELVLRKDFTPVSEPVKKIQEEPKESNENI